MQTLSDTELAAFAAQVDEELNAWYADAGREEAAVRGGRDKKSNKLPTLPKQRAAIEKATSESLESFWEKFQRHARQDLCQPGGKLYEAWKKYRDIDSKTAVASIHSMLFGMGIGNHSVILMVVPVAVFLLAMIFNIGIKAICEQCGPA
jgi:hypothetical protein